LCLAGGYLKHNPNHAPQWSGGVHTRRPAGHAGRHCFAPAVARELSHASHNSKQP
jgi:hypothetical protein